MSGEIPKGGETQGAGSSARSADILRRQREAQQRYEQSEKGLDTRVRYRQSVEGQVAQRRYRESGKGLDTRVRYRQSVEGQVAQRRYRESGKGRDAQRRYRESEKGRDADERKKDRMRDNTAIKKHPEMREWLQDNRELTVGASIPDRREGERGVLMETSYGKLETVRKKTKGMLRGSIERELQEESSEGDDTSDEGYNKPPRAKKAQ